jgi:hypothetical protein
VIILCCRWLYHDILDVSGLNVHSMRKTVWHSISIDLHRRKAWIVYIEINELASDICKVWHTWKHVITVHYKKQPKLTLLWAPSKYLIIILRDVQLGFKYKCQIGGVWVKMKIVASAFHYSKITMNCVNAYVNGIWQLAFKYLNQKMGWNEACGQNIRHL